VPSKDLVPGDIMLLEAGDKIPADARIVEGHSCGATRRRSRRIRTVGKHKDALPEATPINDRKNMVFTGTTVSTAGARPWSPQRPWGPSSAGSPRRSPRSRPTRPPRKAYRGDRQMARHDSPGHLRPGRRHQHFP